MLHLYHFIISYEVRFSGARPERRAINRKRAASRAKKKIRQLCKLAGFDTLLTLTYRGNVQDRELVVRHLKAFHRRMKVLIPGWQYVLVLEKQQRGALHAHLAVHRVPATLPASDGTKVKSFNVIRSVWRSITGEAGGNVDVSKGSRKARRSIAQLASYLSKYIVKAVGEGVEDWKRSYFSSRNLVAPKPERLRFNGYDLLEMIRVVWHCWLPQDQHLWVDHQVTPDGGYWLHSEHPSGEAV